MNDIVVFESNTNRGSFEITPFKGSVREKLKVVLAYFEILSMVIALLSLLLSYASKGENC